MAKTSLAKTTLAKTALAKTALAKTAPAEAALIKTTLATDATDAARALAGTAGIVREGSATARGAPALDEAAFARLHQRTAQGLWRYLRRLGGDATLAEDVLQETYLRYLRRPGQGDDRRQTAYLYRIATNLMRDRWRRQQRERGALATLLARARPAPSHARAVESKVDVDGVLGRLRPRERALLWLAHVDGHSHRDIAHILDLRPASVRVLLFRARRKLARLLEDAGSTLEGLR